MIGARCGRMKIKRTTPTNWICVRTTYLCSCEMVRSTSFCHSWALVVLNKTHTHDVVNSMQKHTGTMLSKDKHLFFTSMSASFTPRWISTPIHYQAHICPHPHCLTTHIYTHNLATHWIAPRPIHPVTCPHYTLSTQPPIHILTLAFQQEVLLQKWQQNRRRKNYFSLPGFHYIAGIEVNNLFKAYSKYVHRLTIIVALYHGFWKIKKVWWEVIATGLKVLYAYHELHLKHVWYNVEANCISLNKKKASSMHFITNNCRS